MADFVGHPAQAARRSPTENAQAPKEHADGGVHRLSPFTLPRRMEPGRGATSGLSDGAGRREPPANRGAPNDAEWVQL